MNEKEARTKDYVLPASIVGRADLSKLLRELESIEEFNDANKIRHDGVADKGKDLSDSMTDFAEQNKLDMADSATLTRVKKHIKTIINHAPNAHMTFASEIDQKTLEKLVGWLRSETHPYALVSVGLQPSLVGGVYLRTPNQVHDFTVKALLHDKGDVLQKELEALA